jgi:hypothetical protein
MRNSLWPRVCCKVARPLKVGTRATPRLLNRARAFQAFTIERENSLANGSADMSAFGQLKNIIPW